MSLWPIKIRLRVETEVEDYFNVDYSEFREWTGGTDLNDATDEQILNFLEAGDEFYPYNIVPGFKPELVSKYPMSEEE